tara:strand:+ start:566 stop:703 length:138 start_codon:yes stop_codon:yes gene_type:complete
MATQNDPVVDGIMRRTIGSAFALKTRQGVMVLVQTEQWQGHRLRD